MNKSHLVPKQQGPDPKKTSYDTCLCMCLGACHTREPGASGRGADISTPRSREPCRDNSSRPRSWVGALHQQSWHRAKSPVFSLGLSWYRPRLRLSQRSAERAQQRRTGRVWGCAGSCTPFTLASSRRQGKCTAGAQAFGITAFGPDPHSSEPAL